MMKYFNPYEILGADKLDLSDIEQIKKAKKRVLADIELDDNKVLQFKGIKLTKADCIRAFDDLDNTDKQDFYGHLLSDKKLNEFLTFGKTSFFDSQRHESIYKMSEFIDFISPYFASQYDKAFTHAVKTGNSEKLKNLVNIPFQINHTYRDQLFNGSYHYLKLAIQEIDAITQQIKNETGTYDEDNVHELSEIVHEKLSPELFNALPEYFQSLRNQAANSIRNLSVNIFNNISDAQVAEDIMEIALEIDTDGLTKSKLEKDYEQISEINAERQEAAQHEDTLHTYAKKLITLKSLIQQADNKSVDLSSIKEQINGFISTAELNELPAVFVEVRNQIVFGLRNLSVSVWNNYSNIDYAIALIEFAQKINAVSDVKSKLTDDLSELRELKQKIEQVKLRSTTSRTTTSTQTNSSNNTGCLVFVGIAIVVGIIYAVSNSGNKSSNNYERSTPSNYSNDKGYNFNHDYSTSNNEYTKPVTTESKYKGNQLANGSSPYDSFFGKGVYNKSHNNWIEFENGNSYDAVVCLVNASSDQTIRNEYIRAGTTFKMTNIPNGTYYIKAFYGNDWNPTKTMNNGQLKGGFDTNFHFSKSDGNNDRMTLKDDGYQYSTGKITLYTVVNGNMSQQKISETEFF